MRQYLAVVAATVIMAAILWLPLSAGKSKAWVYVDNEDVFNKTGARAISMATNYAGDYQAFLSASEHSDDDWKLISYRISIFLLAARCPSQGVPFVKVRIDGWRKDIPAKSFPAGEHCMVSLQPDGWDELIRVRTH